MTETTFCACCYNVATTHSEDGSPRCYLHRPIDGMDPVDAAVMSALRAENSALKATLAKHAESERAWCELATARGEKLAALATACSTWQEWGGHCDTCEFVRQRAANTILDTALFADYCDCGWHATREALAAAKEQP